MNKIEILREYIDKLLLNIDDDEERRCAYVHLYGVAQFCSLIALKRGMDAELATMAGMLHDIYTYTRMDSRDHARKGAVLAKEMLQSLKITNEDETSLICDAIYTHSEKSSIHSDFNEVLIDADVLQHCLYNPLNEIMPNEQSRYVKLKKEFGIL